MDQATLNHLLAQGQSIANGGAPDDMIRKFAVWESLVDRELSFDPIKQLEWRGFKDAHKLNRHSNIGFLINHGREDMNSDIAGRMKMLKRFADKNLNAPEFYVGEMPQFDLAVQDAKLSDELTRRWREAVSCGSVGAYLAATILVGSIVEGVLMDYIRNNLASIQATVRNSILPKDRADRNNIAAVSSWQFSSLIAVAAEADAMPSDIDKIQTVLREYRNYVHPQVMLDQNHHIGHPECMIAFATAIKTVSKIVSRTQSPSFAP